MPCAARLVALPSAPAVKPAPAGTYCEVWFWLVWVVWLPLLPDEGRYAEVAREMLETK